MKTVGYFLGWLLATLPAAGMLLGYDEDWQRRGAVAAVVFGLTVAIVVMQKLPAHFKKLTFVSATVGFVVGAMPTNGDALARCLGGGFVAGLLVLLSAVALRAFLSEVIRER